ncbi:hypothetical protein [Stutzerimonas tarimensis]|uniref:Uncharacterized protein n=1 Tax=Stutzerimonas tarimensis TaxID=1507735 RepID=A0ABV7T7Q0_9GAMM
MVSQLQNTLLLFSLLFTGAGFVLGLFYNNRKVIRLEDKVLRLKRTIRHLQQKDDAPERHEEPVTTREALAATR